MARARKTITLDEKIEKAQDTVEKTKARYDAAVQELRPEPAAGQCFDLIQFVKHIRLLIPAGGAAGMTEFPTSEAIYRDARASIPRSRFLRQIPFKHLSRLNIYDACAFSIDHVNMGDSVFLALQIHFDDHSIKTRDYRHPAPLSLMFGVIITLCPTDCKVETAFLSKKDNALMQWLRRSGRRSG